MNPPPSFPLRRRVQRQALRLLAFTLGSLLAVWALSDSEVQSEGLRAPRSGFRCIENRGQWPEAHRFAVEGPAVNARLHRDGWSIDVVRRREDSAEGAIVRMHFVGADGVEPVGAGSRVARQHYLSTASCSVDTYDAVRYHSMYPGIDVLVREDRELHGGFEYDLELAEGAALEVVRVHCAGAERLSLAADGSLAVRVRLGDGATVDLVQRPPVSWAQVSGELVKVRYRLLDAQTFGFEADDWAGGEALVVDPGFRWSTYLGGVASDEAHAVAWVAGDGVYVGGWAGSSDFPTTPGAYRSGVTRDAFVAKFSEDGSRLIWSTQLGGSEAEEVRGLAVHEGEVVLGGWTSSSDFPVTAGSFQGTYLGGQPLGQLGDGFVTRLQADGSGLVWSTYLGGTGDDFVEAVHVATSGVVTVAGDTTSGGAGRVRFPVTSGAAQERYASVNLLIPDGFVTRLTADGSALIWSTFVGGLAQDEISGLAVDAQGTCTIGGLTGSSDLPVTASAVQRTLPGAFSGFVGRVAADGSAFESLSFLGGTGWGQVRDVAVAANGEILVCGLTSDGSFPVTAHAHQTVFGGGTDGYVARLAMDASRILYATFVGGVEKDDATAIRVTAQGDVIVAGETRGDFPVTAGALQSVFGGGVEDGFLARFDPLLSGLRYASYFGGSNRERMRALAVLADGSSVVVGSSSSTDLPVSAAATQPNLAGGRDVFVAADPAATAATSQLRLTSPHEPLLGGMLTPGVPFVALAPELENSSGETVEVLRVEVVVSGLGDNRELTGVWLYRDVDRDGVLGGLDQVLAGPLSLTSHAERVSFENLAVQLAPFEVLGLLVVLEASASCPRGAEFSVGMRRDVEVRDGSGRGVMIDGFDLASGPVWYCDARLDYVGDQDADGRTSILDVRWLCSRLGDLLPEDPDGDGRVTLRDVDLLVRDVLGQARIAVPVAALERGAVAVLRVFDVQGPIVIRLAGRPLAVLNRTDREIAFALPFGFPTGMHSLEVEIDGERQQLDSVEVR